jgi:hypothetical protein
MHRWALLAVTLLAAPAAAQDAAVRIRFGVGDRQPTNWDGTVTVEGGQVVAIDGWRFGNPDAAEGTSGWKAATRRAAQQRRSNRPNQAANAPNNAPVQDNGVILNLAGATDETRISVTSAQGNFDFRLSEIPYGTDVQRLEGRVQIERTAAAVQLTTGRTDDDFPATAVGPDGTVYVAWVSFTPGLDRDERARPFETEPADLSFLATPPGGDQVWLRTLRDGEWSEPAAVTEGKGDVYKCAAAVDGQGQAWIVWSERRDGNFDVWARPFKDGRFGPVEQVTSNPGNDICPVAAADGQGAVCVAWQGARENVFRIVARKRTAAGWQQEMVVSGQSRSCWSPAIAAGGDRTAIAWDTYEKGDYDVYVREFTSQGAEDEEAVANTHRYEARPSVSYDAEGNLWIAWEESGETWGKNWGALVQGQGIPLYQDRQIGLRVLRDGAWYEPAGFKEALPGARRRRAGQAVRVPALEPESETRRAAQEARTQAGAPYNNLSRLIPDRDGRMWMLVRSRQSDFRSNIGSVWLEYACYCDGEQWIGPVLIPHSDNLLYNVPAVAAPPDGGLFVVHSADHRQDRRVVRAGANANASLGAVRDPFDNDLYVSRITAPSSYRPAVLQPCAAGTVADNPSPSPATMKELAEIARCRAYRTEVNGRSLSILRGEFHRHTEISGDGGNDGPLEDMWRYAIDVAGMDWIGCGDHDNGAGREYPWWLTQKTTDAFQIPGTFDPMFTYERSVVYPEGHRNVVFAQRGVRTLPRLPISDRDDPKPAPDTQMLYKYLHKFDGVCAVHTSATSMGTDWRDNDPEVEPFVEIYQGCRQNYERPGAPRCPTAQDSIGGWEPKGFVNLALLKGYRLAFQSSSDHRSTHISYALIYAEEPSREGILAAMKKRHTYGATDNIIADVRCSSGGREYMMGDEFTASEKPKLRARLIGTAPFKEVVVVKDDQYVYAAAPNEAEFEFEWTDLAAEPGTTSYYYVRGEQADGELVWASPMWIRFQPQ